MRFLFIPPFIFVNQLLEKINLVKIYILKINFFMSIIKVLIFKIYRNILEVRIEFMHADLNLIKLNLTF